MKCVNDTLNNTKAMTLSVFALMFLCALFFVPALSGPLFLDSQKLYSLERLFLDQGWHVSIDQLSFSYSYGRILSMASFYLNIGIEGGLSPYQLKATNLGIHLINGLLILWLTKLVLADEYSKVQREYLSLLVLLLWVIAPINMGAVFYAVQRMTLLSAMFSLVSLIIFANYLQSTRNSQPSRIKNLMYFLSMTLSFVIALLCKETAMLLPLYFGCLYLRFRPLNLTWNAIGAASIVLLALVLLLIGLVSSYGFLDYSGREFTLYERLLTQSRVLVAYITEIALPRSSATNVYRDGFTISRNVLSPVSTIPALLFVFGTLSLGFVLLLRKKSSLLGFGLIFFFSSHVIESTILPLELYFDHRNYLASWGLLVFILCMLTNIFSGRPIILVTIFSALILNNLIIGYFKLESWSNKSSALSTAINREPPSQRAFSEMSALLLAEGRALDSLSMLRVALQKSDTLRANLALQYLFTKCAVGERVSATDLQRIASSNIQIASNEISQALQNLHDLRAKVDCQGLNAGELDVVLSTLSRRYWSKHRDSWHIDYYRVLIALEENNVGLARSIFAEPVYAQHTQAKLFLDYLIEQGKLK